jgi:hypothetical protein
MQDGTPILEMRRNYITLWEQWHGPDPRAERGEVPRDPPLDGTRAVAEGWATADEISELVRRFEARLLVAGVKALKLEAGNLLVTRGEDGALRRGQDGLIAARLCSFEFLRSVDEAEARAQRSGPAGSSGRTAVPAARET